MNQFLLKTILLSQTQIKKEADLKKRKILRAKVQTAKETVQMEKEINQVTATKEI